MAVHRQQRRQLADRRATIPPGRAGDGGVEFFRAMATGVRYGSIRRVRASWRCYGEGLRTSSPGCAGPRGTGTADMARLEAAARARHHAADAEPVSTQAVAQAMGRGRPHQGSCACSCILAVTDRIATSGSLDLG